MTALPDPQGRGVSLRRHRRSGVGVERACAPERIDIAAQQKLQQIWLPNGEDVQVRRVADRRRERARSARIFALNTAADLRPHRTRRDACTKAPISRLSAANIGGGTVDQRNRHHRPPRSSPTRRRARRSAACSAARRPAPISARSRSRAAPTAPTASNRSRRCCSIAARPPMPSPSSKSTPTTSNARTARRSASSTPMQLFYAAARGLDPAARGRCCSKASSAGCGTSLARTARSRLRRATRLRKAVAVNAPVADQLGARRPRPVPGRRRLALSRQRRDRAEAAGGDRRHRPRLMPAIMRPSIAASTSARRT